MKKVDRSRGSMSSLSAVSSYKSGPFIESSYMRYEQKGAYVSNFKAIRRWTPALPTPIYSPYIACKNKAFGLWKCGKKI